MPVSLTPRTSSTTQNVITQQQRSSSVSITISPSVQHDVVLHSNVTEPLLSSSPATTRQDLDLPLDKSNRNQLNRKANSLMTVYEHSNPNESTTHSQDSSKSTETLRARSPSSICDLAYQRMARASIPEKPSDEHETV